MRGLEAKRDALALEEVGLRRLQHAETLERLRRLGLHEIAAAYRTPPPYPRGWELFTPMHPTRADVTAFEIERAQRPPAKRAPPDPAKLGAGELVIRHFGRVVNVR